MPVKLGLLLGLNDTYAVFDVTVSICRSCSYSGKAGGWIPATSVPPVGLTLPGQGERRLGSLGEQPRQGTPSGSCASPQGQPIASSWTCSSPAVCT